MRKILLALAASCVCGPAMAGEVTVDVRDQMGRPVHDAVVIVRPTAGVAPGKPLTVSWPLVMAQQNIAFQPYVLIVPLGSTVSFPNRDKVRHHVYSFSTAKRFELKLYGKDESRTVIFDKPGVVPLGCNIHDSMIAFIYVTDVPYAAKTGADGQAVVPDVPSGAATLTVWHPDLKARTPFTRPVQIAATALHTAAAIELKP
ncbi:methylamine utilization protein [Phenylobacterium sp.]|uniref:methylamine utilization protein n=1 Tax=Phenylobacterium sp. TaxID=1871053 RepID=UPI0025DBF366|nr:methylamine utilization protein [Phenylobacterium sp.]